MAKRKTAVASANPDIIPFSKDGGLTPWQIAALSGAIKETSEKAAKAAIPDSGFNQVDFTVRIVGSVQKGISCPSSSVNERQSVSFYSEAAVHHLLRALGIGQLRLAAALDVIGNPMQLVADAELGKVFNDTATRISAGLPLVPVSISGRAGSVTATVSVQLLD